MASCGIYPGKEREIRFTASTVRPFSFATLTNNHTSAFTFLKFHRFFVGVKRQKTRRGKLTWGSPPDHNTVSLSWYKVKRSQEA